MCFFQFLFTLKKKKKKDTHLSQPVKIVPVKKLWLKRVPESRCQQGELRMCYGRLGYFQVTVAQNYKSFKNNPEEKPKWIQKCTEEHTENKGNQIRVACLSGNVWNIARRRDKKFLMKRSRANVARTGQGPWIFGEEFLS